MTAVRHRTERASHRARPKADRRKLLAIVSAFSVLGVGAGVTTLASWQESLPLVGGTGGTAGIGSSTLCIEESLDGGTNWTPYTGSVTLSFPSTINSLSPGDTGYASIQLAACPGSVAASVTLAPTSGVNSASTFLSALTYSVNTGFSTANCSAAGFSGGSSLIAPSASTAGSGSFTLPVNTATTGSPSSTKSLCFALGLPSGAANSLEGQSGTPSWTLAVQS